MKTNTMKILVNFQLDTTACWRLSLWLGLIVYKRRPASVREVLTIQHQTEPFSLIGKEGLKDFQKNITFSIFNEASVHQVKSYHRLPEILFQTLGNIGIKFSNPSSWIRLNINPESLLHALAMHQIYFLICKMTVLLKPVCSPVCSYLNEIMPVQSLA